MARKPIFSADDGDENDDFGGVGRGYGDDSDFDAGTSGGYNDAFYGAQSDDDAALRPTRIDDMVGQRDVYERLQIAIQASKKRGETLGHILFDGPPGLGKTTFATCIPRELGVEMQIANGATMRAPKDVVPYLTNATEGSVIFIDEIHRLQKSVEEFLYPAMEDFRIDVVMGEGVNARTLNI
ncbi:MAG: AAA family ATPase, partial [Thermoguttaceae bacterium]|nr:AAA family ATPase [Thermoguttaceae bacterium]